MIEDCVIIGGGIAGLSAANQLVDKGYSPLIIDAGKFPSHKICGEFLSHECLPTLHQWAIPVSTSIYTSRFICGGVKNAFTLPIPAGSCSRYIFDNALLERALKKGARAFTETAVNSLTPHSEYYELILSNGETIKAKHLMIGTGRIPKLGQFSQKPPEMKYVGFKAHFENMDSDNCVEIHAFTGGYLGISKVDEKTTNIACLFRKDCVGTPEDFLPKITQGRMLFANWLTGQLPEFGIRENPNLENVFWIGDAAGSIPPASGEGLAIAVTSGTMAADYLHKSNAFDFRKAWLKRYRRRFFLAACIHKTLTTQHLNTLALKTCNLFPSLSPYLWAQTREKT